jgi:hypothetical protein
MTVSNSLINMSRKNLFTIPGTWEFNAPKTSYSSISPLAIGETRRPSSAFTNGWPSCFQQTPDCGLKMSK